MLALSISGCSTLHFVALSDDLTKKLATCQRPIEIPPEWVACKDGDEACRRARELPVHTKNAERHHECAKIVDDVKAEAERVKAQGK